MGLLDRLFGRKRRSPGGSEYIMPQGDGIRPFGPTDAPIEWTEERDRFYEEHFGEIEITSHEILRQIPYIDVCACKPDTAKGRDYYSFVTSGMSDVQMVIPKGVSKDWRRVELISYVTEEDARTILAEENPWLFSWLRYLAAFPHGYRTWFGIDHTVPNGNPPEPILPDSLLTTAFLLPALFEPEHVRDGLRCGDEPVNFLWVVLITDAECEYKLAHGSEALLRLLLKNGLSKALDMHRRSYV